MSVIAASSVKVATLVDGTLRATFDIEPADAQDAFALFAKPGTPVALAALKSAKAKTEVGPVCAWAVRACQDPEFRQWLMVGTEEEAKAKICELCGIESRKELDSNAVAMETFHARIRLPYAAWQKARR